MKTNFPKDNSASKFYKDVLNNKINFHAPTIFYGNVHVIRITDISFNVLSEFICHNMLPLVLSKSIDKSSGNISIVVTDAWLDKLAHLLTFLDPTYNYTWDKTHSVFFKRMCLPNAKTVTISAQESITELLIHLTLNQVMKHIIHDWFNNN